MRKSNCCSLCNKKGNVFLKDTIKNDNFSLLKCTNCGLFFVSPQPSKKELNKFYPNNYYGEGGRFKKNIEKYLTNLTNFQRKKEIFKYKQSGKILDIGCGTGKFLNVFDKSKWQKFGIEPNILGYEGATKKDSIKMFNRDLINCELPSGHFDVVTMWHSLEHIDNPLETMREVHRITKEGGIFIISTPNSESLGFKTCQKKWFHLDMPRHLFLYNEKILKKNLEKNNFKTIKATSPLLEYPLDLCNSISNTLSRSQFVKLAAFPLALGVTQLLKLINKFYSRGEIIKIIAQKTKNKTAE